MRMSLVALLFPVVASSLNPIVVGGNMMWDSVTKERFYLNGIAYGYGIEDTLQNYWEKAVDNIAELGFNAIRIYEVNPNCDLKEFEVKDHSYSKFMEYAKSKGLYVIIPLTPRGDPPWNYCVLNRAGLPNATDGSTCYPWCLLTFAENVVNTFAQYPNTLMFTVGNEVLNDETMWGAGPCVKGFTRDIKNYMRGCKHNMRYVPLMYAAADNAMMGVSADDTERLKLQYLTCGEESTRIDVYGANIYRWCSSVAMYHSSQYEALVENLKNLTSAMVLSEYGCGDFYWVPGKPKEPFRGQRDWKQLPAVFSNPMALTFSGGSAYSYGVEGGEMFAFYSGGDKGPRASPGYVKMTGDPHNMSNADNFIINLHQINPPKMTPVGATVCNWTAPGYVNHVPTCPAILYKKYNVDPVIPSRVPDEPFITCPAHKLTPIEEIINFCTSPTPAPTDTQSPTVSPTPQPPETTTVAPGGGDGSKGLASTEIGLIAGGAVVLVGAVAAYLYFRGKPKKMDDSLYRSMNQSASDDPE